VGRRVVRKPPSTEAPTMRSCNFILPEHVDIRISTYARKHRITRSEACIRAFALLCAGMRIGFGGDEGESDEAA
jgi:hypothetical protein